MCWRRNWREGDPCPFYTWEIWQSTRYGQDKIFVAFLRVRVENLHLHLHTTSSPVFMIADRSAHTVAQGNIPRISGIQAAINWYRYQYVPDLACGIQYTLPYCRKAESLPGEATSSVLQVS